MIQTIMIVIAGLCLFLYLSVGAILPLISQVNKKWYARIGWSIIYAIFWIPILIAGEIIARKGVIEEDDDI